MKNFMLTLIAVLYFFNISINSFCQEIEIELTFTGDTIIYPFEGIDKISELTMEGSATLDHDTSLVRVILQDEAGFQYMVFETYGLICPYLLMPFKEYCDETCALDQIKPVSLIIQLIDARLTLKSLYYSDQAKENVEELRYKAKRTKDAEKIEIMNEQIPTYGMSWTAGDNEIVASYYDQKRRLFTDAYNLLGYDYYDDGVFEFLGHRNYPKVNPDFVRYFDWRSKHGANDASSPYWDGDVSGSGWLTPAKYQGTICESCWAFAAAGAVEACANLSSIRFDTNISDYILPLDLDLSEQHIISCNDGGSDCDGGSPFWAFDFMRDEGVVLESCCEYNHNDTSCNALDICDPINTLLTIYDFNNSLYYQDSIRKSIIKYGPCVIGFDYPNVGPHDVVACGFVFDPSDSTLVWIFKNSTGLTGVEHGFERMKIEDAGCAHFINTPIKINGITLKDSCLDLDNDGYDFWGIGEAPENCNCSQIEDCDDNDPFVGGYDENFNCGCIFEMDQNPHHISVNTTWSDTTYINFLAIIDSGACLTISSYAAFAPEAGIRVTQGGKLILDSAYLTKVCPDLWRGIDVLGSDTIQALDEYFGKVVVRNNSIIEFAEVGIANHCRTCGYQDMQCGGIISVENSIFRDNERDILLNPFSTYWFNHDLPYTCVISNCHFITTDNLYPDHIPQAHIEMKDIYGVMIYGCKFENQSDLDNNPYPIRGAGISSIDAYFMISPYCLTPAITPCEDFDTCKFTRLEYGIKAMNSRSKRTLNIQGLQFDRNFVAISLSGLEYASVLSNTFKCPRSIEEIPANRFTGGLFMEGCSGYHVENNEFKAFRSNMQQAIISPCYGIGVKNSGDDNNEIYNNYLNHLNVGIFAIGENRGRESGLCLKCNVLDNNFNDFIVVTIDDPPLGNYQGINRYQGDPNDSTSFSAPAGNTFTWFPPDSIANPIQLLNYNYLNDAENLWYIHHQRQFDPLTFPLDSNYTRETIELKEWTYLGYEKSTACPSGLGGGGSLKNYSSPKSILIEADFQLDILKTQLNAFIDGGNTAGLNFEVMTSLPDEGLEIRQQLLNESPYLSDTVLKQAIYKEDVLPNAMIRDVLEANPQSAKSDEILSALDSRYEPMPDYMMAQIMQGRKYLGAKEVLETKIQSWQQIRAKAKADLMREFLLDTNMVSPLDSVIIFLENETGLESKYDLALAQWNNSDLAGAWVTLYMIPSQFVLNENQIINHENYLEYFGILQTLPDSNWQANQLDSASVSMLFYLKESGYPKIDALARGLLVKGKFYNYFETIAIPDLTKSSWVRPVQYKENPSANKEKKLWLFPNPAGDYVIACYDLDPIYKFGEIRLIDLKGNLLKSFDIRSGKNQLVMDLKDYPIGFYIISLNSSNQIIDSKKLSKGGN